MNDIEILEEYIKTLKLTPEELLKSDETIKFIGYKEIQAIENLIQRNKDLEIKIKQIESLKHIEEDLTSVYLNGFYEGESKWKSKIKELYEYYKDTGYNELELVLKDLLEEGE